MINMTWLNLKSVMLSERSPGSIPGWGTEISQAMRRGQN